MFLIAQSGEQCPYRPRFVGSWNLRVEPIRIFQTVSLLDFSHLRSKGVGYARHQSAQREVISMRTLPATMIQILSPFAPLFSKRVWQHAQVLLAGAILAPGRRTVSCALRAVGLDQQEQFHPGLYT